MKILNRAIAALSVVVAIIALSMSPAAAHTAFESSTPEDGSQVDEVAGQIQLTFAGVAEPAGEGFVVLDGDGTLRTPTSATTADQLTYVLTFDPPLSGGQVGVRWSVAAPDAHPIDGSFSFNVDAALPSDPVDGDVAAADAELAVAEEAVTPEPAPAGEGGKAEVDNAANVQALSEQTVDAVPSSQAAMAMEDFLGQPERPNATGLVAGLGRVLVLGGALVAIGGAVFAAFVIHGTKREFSMIVDSITVAAWLVMAGAVMSLVARLAVTNGGWTALTFGAISEVVVSSFGIAVALKLVGGWMLSRVDVTVVAAAETADPVLSLHQLVPVGAGPIEAARPSAPTSLPDDSADKALDFVWRSHDNSLAVPIGALLLLVAFLFDGHTVTEGNRYVTAIVDIVHVLAGAVWAGGLVMMAQVIWRRHRRGDDSRALELAVRFSVVAAIALSAAGVAGLALTFIIIDSVSDIWTTSWGQLLIVKTVLVALAGLAGLYNHRVLIPKLAGGDGFAVTAEAEFRRAVTIEGAIIGSVVIATALLVAASSVS